MTIPTKECIFCENEFLGRDMNGEIVWSGDPSGESHGKDGVCLKCADDLVEADLDAWGITKHEGFDYSVLIPSRRMRLITPHASFSSGRKKRGGIEAEKLIFKITAKCLIGHNRCEEETVEYLYPGFPVNSIILGPKFPQEFKIGFIDCCDHKQYVDYMWSEGEGMHCDEVWSHDCQCKNEEVPKKIKKRWKSHKHGHHARQWRRRRDDKIAFIHACEKHGNGDHKRYNKLCKARFSGGYKGEWLEPTEWNCAQLRECESEPVIETAVLDLHGRMIGNGYVCHECDHEECEHSHKPYCDGSCGGACGGAE